MAEAKYRGAYLALRRAWSSVVARGEARCAEPICLMPTRHIPPGSKWDLSHDPTGTVILGPSHRSCVTDPREQPAAMPPGRTAS